MTPAASGRTPARGYLRVKNEEAYTSVFTVHYPDEERVAARPLKRAPCYERMKALGAVFGTVYGWERPNWFAPAELRPTQRGGPCQIRCAAQRQPPACRARASGLREKWSFRRSNYFGFVGIECRNVHENVGLLDMSAFGEIRGFGARRREMAGPPCRQPDSEMVGRIDAQHSMLSKNGGVRSEFTIFPVREVGKVYLVGAGAFERHDWVVLLEGPCRRDGSVYPPECDDTARVY